MFENILHKHWFGYLFMCVLDLRQMLLDISIILQAIYENLLFSDVRYFPQWTTFYGQRYATRSWSSFLLH